MCDFLRFCLIEPFEDGDFAGIIFGLFMWLMFICTLVVTFYFVDWLFGGEFIGLAKVVGRDYVPGHFVTQVISSGKTTTTSVVWIPDAWYLIADYNGEVLSCPIPESEYLTPDGTLLNANLTSGLFTSDTYCDGVHSYGK